MAKRFSELWKISSIVYREISFQSVFSLRLGTPLPSMDGERIKKMVRQIELNMLISKILVTIFVAILAVLPFGYWLYFVKGLKLAEELAIASFVSIFLSSLFFLLIMLGLQATTSLVATRAFEVLGSLPIPRDDISKVALLSFIRIFDVPLVAALIVFPTTFFMITCSFLGGFASLFSVGLTEIFAITLTMGLSKFFYSRIVGGGGNSKYKIVMRFIYMLIWILPSFGIYFAMNFATQILQVLAHSLTQISIVQALALALVYPFSLGFAVAFATLPHKISLAYITVLTVSLVVYTFLGYLGLKYAGSTIRRIGSGGVVIASRVSVRDLVIRPRSTFLGVIFKDLRVASRSPSYASILMLPAIQTVIIIISFGLTKIDLPMVLGFLAGVSLVSLIAAPTLFSAEMLASAYTRSLPLKRRTVIAAKIFLSTLTYVGCVVVLAAFMLYLRKDLISAVIFGLVQALCVAAGCMLELLLLTKKLWNVTLSPGSIYASLSTFLMVFVPGVILCLTPMILCFVIGFSNTLFTLTVFLASAVSEIVTVTAITNLLVKN